MLQARVASDAFLEVAERLMEGTARLIPPLSFGKGSVFSFRLFEIR